MANAKSPAKTAPNQTAVAASGSVAEQLRGVISRGETVPEEDPRQVAQRIAEQLLEADSLDALFAQQKTVNAVDLNGHALKLRNAILRNSELENTDAYVLVDALDLDTGEVLVFNTSSPRIMAQIARAMELGAIDPDKAKTLDVRVVEVGQAKPGLNAPMGLTLL